MFTLVGGGRTTFTGERTLAGGEVIVFWLDGSGRTTRIEAAVGGSVAATDMLDGGRREALTLAEAGVLLFMPFIDGAGGSAAASRSWLVCLG